jgi:cell division protein ZapA (FtsZ GTPase activity inhibitor)
MEARCVEQNDDRSHVSHEVTNTIDGEKYRLVISAECPMTAIRIAREVPITYWEKLNA